MTSPLHTDFLAFLPVVIEQLSAVKEVKKVFIINSLSDLDTGKNINATDGCAYVILYSYAPSNEANKGKNQAMDVVFDVILARQHYNKTGVGSVGTTLTAIAKSLIGFKPCQDNNPKSPLTTSPIYLDKGAGVLYQQGFALYPLRFKTQTVIVSDN